MVKKIKESQRLDESVKSQSDAFNKSEKFPCKLWHALQSSHKGRRCRKKPLMWWSSNGKRGIVETKDFPEKVLQMYPGLLQISALYNFKRQLREYYFNFWLEENSTLLYLEHPNFHRENFDSVKLMKTRKRDIAAKKKAMRREQARRRLEKSEKTRKLSKKSTKQTIRSKRNKSVCKGRVSELGKKSPKSKPQSKLESKATNTKLLKVVDEVDGHVKDDSDIKITEEPELKKCKQRLKKNKSHGNLSQEYIQKDKSNRKEVMKRLKEIRKTKTMGKLLKTSSHQKHYFSLKRKWGKIGRPPKKVFELLSNSIPSDCDRILSNMPKRDVCVGKPEENRMTEKQPHSNEPRTYLFELQLSSHESPHIHAFTPCPFHQNFNKNHLNARAAVCKSMSSYLAKSVNSWTVGPGRKREGNALGNPRRNISAKTNMLKTCVQTPAEEDTDGPWLKAVTIQETCDKTNSPTFYFEGVLSCDTLERTGSVVDGYLPYRTQDKAFDWSYKSDSETDTDSEVSDYPD